MQRRHGTDIHRAETTLCTELKRNYITQACTELKRNYVKQASKDIKVQTYAQLKRNYITQTHAELKRNYIMQTYRAKRKYIIQACTYITDIHRAVENCSVQGMLERHDYMTSMLIFDLNNLMVTFGSMSLLDDKQRESHL